MTPRQLDAKEIGRKIRHLRLKHKMTQWTLAFSVDLNSSYIALLERGRRIPSLEVLYRLARHLKCRPEDLLS